MAGEAESPIKPPKLLRQFSKDQSTDERKLMAGQIRVKRQEYFGPKKIAQEQKLELEGQLIETEIDIDRQLQRIKYFDEQLSQLSGSWFDRAWNYFKIRHLNPQLTAEQAALQQFQEQQKDTNLQYRAISEQLTQPGIPAELEEARKMLQDFYQKEQQKWVKTPYAGKEIQRTFTEQNLASLSLDDYILLLQRFPGEMVTHVTRQGIRDHWGHTWHRAGIGSYFDGFINILRDGRLRSTLGAYIREGLKEEYVMEFLLYIAGKKQKFTTKDEALRILDRLINPQNESEGSGSYADKAALHFAVEDVADSYYGSESGNEIFIAFPAVFVASQYFFRGQFTQGDDDMRNDLWVWANEERGIDINAGIIFIPKETRVDPATGSRYHLDANQNPSVNQAYIDKIKELAASAEFRKLAERLDDIRRQSRVTTSLAYAEQTDQSPEAQQLLKRLEPIRQILADQFGVTDRRLQTALLEYRQLHEYRESRYPPFDEKVREILESQHILYIEAEDTIPSRDFWENYFVTHPDQQPSKIVYYEGQNPIRAIQEWKRLHGITNKAKSADLGFYERSIKYTHGRANIGLDRFRSIAEAAINNYFNNNPEAV